MNSFNNTNKMPFTVSLALIFGYSLLQVMVPTDPAAAEAIAATTEERPKDEPRVTTTAVNTPANEPAASIH